MLAISFFWSPATSFRPFKSSVTELFAQIGHPQLLYGLAVLGPLQLLQEALPQCFDLFSHPCNLPFLHPCYGDKKLRPRHWGEV